MPNIGLAFKAEITRISRKEVKAYAGTLHKTTIILKKHVAELKKRLETVEAENRRLVAAHKSVEELPGKLPPEAAEKVRISSKGIRTLRRKLGLSQNEFAKLLGISSQAVYTMEHKSGRVKMRSATLSRFVMARSLGKREAKRKLETITKK